MPRWRIFLLVLIKDGPELLIAEHAISCLVVLGNCLANFTVADLLAKFLHSYNDILDSYLARLIVVKLVENDFEACISMI